MSRYFRWAEVKADAETSLETTRYGNCDIYPVPPGRRTYTTTTFATYWMTVGICLGSWNLGSNYIANGLSAGETCGAVLVGSCIASLNAFLCGHVGVDYHLPFSMMGRAAFGIHGGYFAVLLPCFESFIYFGIQSYWGGQAVVIILNSIFPQFMNMKNTLPDSAEITTQSLIGFLLYFVVFVPIVWFVPPHKLRFFLYASFIGICVTFAGILGWAVHTNGGHVSLMKPEVELSPLKRRFLILQCICAVAGTYTGSSVRVSDWTRFSKTKKAPIPGMLFAMPVTVTIAALIGVIVASATSDFYGTLIWNPLEMLIYTQKNHYTAACRAGTFFAGLGFLSSQVFENITQNTLSSGMDLVALLPKYLNIRRSTLLVVCIGILIQPWRFVAEASTFLSVISSFGVFLSPLAGILLADYWIVRRRIWKVPDLYKRGIYWYHYGVNWRAVVVFAICVAPSLPGMAVHISNADVASAAGWERLYQLNFFFNYPASILLYSILGYLFPPEHLGEKETMEGVYVHEESLKSDEEASDLEMKKVSSFVAPQ